MAKWLKPKCDSFGSMPYLAILPMPLANIVDRTARIEKYRAPTVFRQSRLRVQQSAHSDS
jgi:hypothetical protein